MKYFKYLLAFLSVLLSGFLIYAFDKIWGDKINWANYRNVDFGNFLFLQVNVPVRVVYVIIFIALLYPAFLLLRLLLKKNEKGNNIQAKKARTKEFNTYRSPEKKLYFSWNVYFDYLSTPKIDHLTPFCTRHGEPPLKLIIGGRSNGVSQYVCTVPNCKTHISAEELKNTEHYLESILVSLYHKS